jgi:hypothetical protein
MADLFRRLLYPAFVATIFVTLWAMGHAQALADQAYNRRSWPPLNPEMFQFANDAGNAKTSASLSPDDL